MDNRTNFAYVALLIAILMAAMFVIALWRGRTWFWPNRSASRAESPLLFWAGQAIVAVFGSLALIGAVNAFVGYSN